MHLHYQAWSREITHKCFFCSLLFYEHYVIKFVSDLRQVDGFLRVLQFPPPRYIWNIAESGIKHHNPNPRTRVKQYWIKSICIPWHHINWKSNLFNLIKFNISHGFKTWIGSCGKKNSNACFRLTECVHFICLCGCLCKFFLILEQWLSAIKDRRTLSSLL